MIIAIALLAAVPVGIDTTAAGVPVTAAAAKAELRLAGGAPLTLRGTHFESRERVRLIVVARRKVTKSLTATGGGAFVVRLHGITVGRCQGFTAFAVGSRGSRASLSSPNVYCPPRP
jgi:hypothetical protein